MQYCYDQVDILKVYILNKLVTPENVKDLINLFFKDLNKS